MKETERYNTCLKCFQSLGPTSCALLGQVGNRSWFICSQHTHFPREYLKRNTMHWGSIKECLANVCHLFILYIYLSVCVYGSVWFCGFQEDELLAQTVSLWDRKDTNEGKISEKISSVHTVCDEERKQRALACCRWVNEGFLLELRMWYLIIFKHTDICIQTPPHTPTPFHIRPHLPAHTQHIRVM